MMSESHDRLYWSCRRGMLELDLILIPFLQHEYPNLESHEQQLFKDLLESTDMELFAWLTGKELPEAENQAALVTRIRDYANQPNRDRTV